METFDHIILRDALKGALANLEKNKEKLNTLNVFPVPDGDTGTNMSLTVKSAVKNALSSEEESCGKILMKMSQGSLMGARGNSGVILSQIFRGFAETLKNEDSIEIKMLAKAFRNAADTAYKAVMKPTEGTILTVIRGMGDFAMRHQTGETDILSFVEKVLEEGRNVLNKTPDMLPVLKEAGVVDAGGAGLITILEGAVKGLKGEDISNIEIDAEPVIKREVVEDGDIKFGYCTEFMINAGEENVNKFKSFLEKQGDSIVVVGSDEIIKVHVHTNDPGLVISQALKIGSLTDIKIDNMRYQHNERLLKDELEEMRNGTNGEKKPYSLISVSAGDGIKTLFKDLGVDYIIEGGQTMNPSTEDFLNAIGSLNADNIIILPNNKNIILSANQARELSEKNVYVIETKSIPQGISAILNFEYDASPEENIEAMNEAINHVKTGQVTYAVRDVSLNGKEIKENSIMAISQGDIVGSGEDISSVTKDLINKMIDEDSSLITVLYGEDIKEEDAEALREDLESSFEGMDIELIYGGQPIYYYLISVE